MTFTEWLTRNQPAQAEWFAGHLSAAERTKPLTYGALRARLEDRRMPTAVRALDQAHAAYRRRALLSGTQQKNTPVVE